MSSQNQTIVSTKDFLSGIDSELISYADILVSKGFANSKTLAHLTFGDIPEIPVGLRRLLIHEVSKLRSPHTRRLMGQKDASDFNTGTCSSSSDLSPIVISDTESSSAAALKPKQLFPGSAQSPQLNINTYEYQTPMDKHLSKLIVEISKKEVEIQKLHSEVDSMKQSDELGSDVAITCSCCHGPNHIKQRCLDNPCPTSISCGKIRFHKTEMKIFETKKTQLKKITCDKIALESECRKV